MFERPKFKIIYSNEVIEFLNSLENKVKEKIMFNINKSKYVVDTELFKKLKGSDIWEFRTKYNGSIYRVFAFWDTEADTLVITTHGIIKKTQKTPSKEIQKAESIRREYFNEKNKTQTRSFYAGTVGACMRTCQICENEACNISSEYVASQGMEKRFRR